jgi:hypothetical protein
MSNQNKNSASQEHQIQKSRVNASPGYGLALLASFGTSFSVCLVTAKLFHYYMVELFRQGLDGGVGTIWIMLFGFPIL